MAALSVVLTPFSTVGNSRTSSLVGHTALKPRLVIEKRRVPENGQNMIEASIKSLYATANAEGIVLPQKVTIETIVRYPANGSSAELDLAVANHRAIVASDNFATTAATQQWL